MAGFSYKKAFREIYNLRKVILYIFLALLLFVLTGVLFKNSFMSFQEELEEYIVYEIQGRGLISLIYFIITHNLQANLFVILTSVLVILPFFALVSNGFIIGAFVARSTIESGYSSILRLLPHGIFEVPAILISFALSYKIIDEVYLKKKNLFYAYWDALKTFILIVIPLLIIAGIIEGCLVYFIGSRFQ